MLVSKIKFKLMTPFSPLSHITNYISLIPSSLLSLSASPSFWRPGTRPRDNIFELPRAVVSRGKVKPISTNAKDPFVVHGGRVAVTHDGLPQVVDAVIHVQLPGARRGLVKIRVGVDGPAEREVLDFLCCAEIEAENKLHVCGFERRVEGDATSRTRQCNWWKRSSPVTQYPSCKSV